jgi:hypothetical protein
MAQKPKKALGLAQISDQKKVDVAQCRHVMHVMTELPTFAGWLCSRIQFQPEVYNWFYVFMAAIPILCAVA